MLGLRRFNSVQIDIWQGQAADFAADCLVCFHDAESPSFQMESGNGSSTVIMKVAFKSELPMNAEGFKALFNRIFFAAEGAGLRHLVIPWLPGALLGSDDLDLFLGAGFSSLHQWLKSERPTSLGRVTFVADSASGYHILQTHLFTEYPDELDDEGF